MSSVVSTSSTEEPEQSLWSPRPRVSIPGLIENELASTKRDWAVKPPPGTESEPLTWDEVTKL
jgi:hypothetical protein